MFFIPGFLVALITFPGVIVHEIAHRFFADVACVPVYDVCYFGLGTNSGYVIHGQPKNLKQAFLISVGPLIINSLLCAVITSAAIFPYLIFSSSLNGYEGALLWLGISIGMHAFPSNHDMKEFSRAVNEHHNYGLILIVAKFFEWIFKIANALSFFWFDAIYAIGLGFLIPLMLHAA